MTMIMIMTDYPHPSRLPQLDVLPFSFSRYSFNSFLLCVSQSVCMLQMLHLSFVLADTLRLLSCVVLYYTCTKTRSILNLIFGDLICPRDAVLFNSPISLPSFSSSSLPLPQYFFSNVQPLIINTNKVNCCASQIVQYNCRQQHSCDNSIGKQFYRNQERVVIFCSLPTKLIFTFFRKAVFNDNLYQMYKPKYEQCQML